MNCFHRSLHRRHCDDERDIVFRGTLRDGDDIDTVLPQRAKHPTGNPRRAAHLFADYRDNCYLRIHCDVFHLMMSQVGGERLP